jgi:signal recognition particle receptor subunit beta
MSLIIVSLVIGIIIFVLIKRVLGGKNAASKKRDAVLIVGPSAVGKTVLAYKLCHDKIVTTVTSMKPSTLLLKSKEGRKNATLIDFPGHPRLRPQLIAEYIPRAKKIVFVLDSTNARLREAAELLYDLFTDPVVEKNSPPILIACAKIDGPASRPVPRIKLSLQDEIEKIRKTRQSVGELGEESRGRSELGRQGQAFSLDRDAPVELRFEAVSSVSGAGIESLISFIE